MTTNNCVVGYLIFKNIQCFIINIHVKFFISCSLSRLGPLARKSKDEANLYVFITGKGTGGILGIAYVGTVCNSARTNRVSINRYGRTGRGGPRKNKVMYTAEVR